MERGWRPLFWNRLDWNRRKGGLSVVVLGDVLRSKHILVCYRIVNHDSEVRHVSNDFVSAYQHGVGLSDGISHIVGTSVKRTDVKLLPGAETVMTQVFRLRDRSEITYRW